MPFRKAKFNIDGQQDVFEGYTDGQLWNGWECPHFPKTELPKIAAWLGTQEAEAEYVEAADTFVVMSTESEIETEEFPGLDIVVDGEIIHVYAIGAWSWIWDEVEDEDEEDEDV